MQVKKVTFNEPALLYSGKAPLKKQVVQSFMANPTIKPKKYNWFLRSFFPRIVAKLKAADNNLDMLQGAAANFNNMLNDARATLAASRKYVHNMTKPIT